MRRTEIISSCTSLLTAIRESGVFEALQSLLSRQDKPQPLSALPSLNAFSLAATKFDSATKIVAHIFGLDGLDNPNNWEAVIDAGKGHESIRYYQSLSQALTFIPKFTELLHQKGIEDYTKTLSPPIVNPEVSTVSVILLEDEKQFSTPERLIDILLAVTDLYTALAEIQGKSTNTLSVLSCDSGSDKSFDFLGHAGVIKQLKELIIEIWNSVVFFKEKKALMQISVLTESLPVFSQIADLEEKGQIAPELAEQLRRRIAGGTANFVKAGAIIPEIREHAFNEPRVLMAPERKLLMPPPQDPQPPEETPPGNNPEPPPNISEVMERLRRLENKQSDIPPEEPPPPRA